MIRICRKCHRSLTEKDFYKAGNCLDTVCKDCRKARIKERYIENSKDEVYMEKERARGREKYRRLNYRNTDRTAGQIQKRILYPGLRGTKRKLGLADLPRTMELHHWNYNKIDEVIALDRRLHSRVHTLIRLDVDKGIYYDGDTALDTIEKHLAVVKTACEMFGYDYSKVLVITNE